MIVVVRRRQLGPASIKQAPFQAHYSEEQRIPKKYTPPISSIVRGVKEVAEHGVFAISEHYQHAPSQVELWHHMA
jgi:hypothetical protein